MRPRPGASARRCASTSTSSGRRSLPEGNLQAAARTVRYDAAARLRERTGASVIVTGHTRTDVAETAIYRLAVVARLASAARPVAAQRARDPAAARARPRPDPRAGGRRGAAVRRRRDQRRRDLRPQPDPRPGAAGASRRQPGRRAEHRRDPSGARRGGGSCSSGSCSRRSPKPGSVPATVGVSAAALAALGARRSSGSPCARSPSAPPGARSRWGASARPRSSALRYVRRAAWSSSAVACARSANRARVQLPRRGRRRRPGPRGGRARPARARAARRLGDPRGASSGPGRARRSRPRDARRATRSTTGSRSAPGATAIASARSACAARRRSATCSPTARCPARRATRSRWSPVAGDVAWVAGVAVSDDFRLAPTSDRVAVLSARRWAE